MKRSFLAAFLALLVVTPSGAEEKNTAFDVGGDSFLAGRTVVFDAPDVEDLFAAGEIVRGEADIAGSAHMAGRKVKMTGAVGGDAYLAGMDVVLDGPVTGNATVTGYDVVVGAVGGNLRVSGSDLVIRGPVAGYALIAGEEIHVEGKISGDAVITGRELTFADGVEIEGRITVFEKEPGALDIPEEVAPEERIQRRDISEWEDSAKDMEILDWRRVLVRFLWGVVVVAALASLIAAIMPKTLAELRQGLLERPFRNLLFGFLAQSVFVGSAFVLLMTVIGILLSPAAILIALVAGFAGYVVAVYAFGVGLLSAFGRPVPDRIGTRALAAGLGAVVVGIVALIPFLGWLFVLLLMLAGVGAITMKLFRPAFFVPS